MVRRQKVRRCAVWLAGLCLIFSLVLLAGGDALAQEFGLGDIPLHPEVYKKHLKKQTLDMAIPLPAAYDARDEGIVTSPKNQGACGSCWAFASVGAIESHLLKAYGFGPNDLSEQQLVSCNEYMSGCCGGSSSSIRFWESIGPIYEGCFSYAESGTSCSMAQSTVPCSDSAGCDELSYRVLNWHTVSATPTDFKTSLYIDGPSYWRYNVYSDFDTYWGSGSAGDVYVSQPGYAYRGGHAILLIGWDDSKGAYLCKNSWGTYGGPNGDGTFWIAYSGHAQSMSFGMSNFNVTSVGCGDGICDSGEDACECPEDCGTPPVSETPLDTCADAVDNDCDGLADCDDIDCAGDPICACGNGICDVGEDSCDCPEDCGTPPATEEPFLSCADAVDNDCDGLADCDDSDCVGDPTCPCGNGVCEGGENCVTCPEDCISGQGGTCDSCFKGVCNGDCHPNKEGPECQDCAPSHCCGDGTCEGLETVDNCAIDCACLSDAECDDGNPCTIDVCDPLTGGCSSTWAACGLDDGCCAPDCTSETDPDCSSQCIPNKQWCNCDGRCGKHESNDTCPWDCP